MEYIPGDAEESLGGDDGGTTYVPEQMPVTADETKRQNAEDTAIDVPAENPDTPAEEPDTPADSPEVN